MRKLILAVLLSAGIAFSGTVINFAGWSQTLSGGEVLAFAPANFTLQDGSTALFTLTAQADTSTFGTGSFGPFNAVLPFDFGGTTGNINILSAFMSSGVAASPYTWGFAINKPACGAASVDGTSPCVNLNGTFYLPGTLGGSVATLDIHAVAFTNAPEPGTWGLMGAGLVLAGALRRRLVRDRHLDA